ncbi:glutaminyl-peptide cyclotransferase isoform X1 [Gracilaria domingensis]|nr:glutaminyl-peptide cyclotransferase isoform X1 [Gracilaria domingensis]
MKRRRQIKPPSARKTVTVTARQHRLLPRIQLNQRNIVLFGIVCFICALLIVFRSQRGSERLKAYPRFFSPLGFGTRTPPVSPSSASKDMAPVFKAKVLQEYDHDHKAFTQGLVYFENHMYESTGLYGESSLRKVDVSTGKLLDLHQLESNHFGEGLAVVGEDGSLLMQVLWKVGKGYVYDRNTLHRLFEFSYDGDAWGLASLPGDRNQIYLSDGTSAIKVFRLQGSSFKLTRQFTVLDGSKEVGLLNELEIVRDELWANVWMSDFIARIDPRSGKVKGWLDLRETLRQSAIPKGHRIDVLNGIAYDEKSSSIYVTGKYWPKLFSIGLTDQLVADNITEVTKAFFLNPEDVEYVHNHVIV